jgi:hypothetical protein
LAWWKFPHHFASKKEFRWVEHGAKVEFKKGLPFAPKPSAPKFVDPQDVDFTFQDLLKGRRIGAYHDLPPGGDQFLSRSRVHTPPGKGKQRIVHALCSLNEATVKRQTTYGDLRMLKSVVKPQDFCSAWMLKVFYTPQASQVLFVASGSAAVCREQVYRAAARRLLCLLKFETRPRAFGVLVSNASAPAPPLPSSRRFFPRGVAARVDQLAQDLDERHVRCEQQLFAATACARCCMSTTC